MDYPSVSVWRQVLCSPKMLFLIAFFLLWDHYILNGALPYLACLLCGYITNNFQLITESHVEVIMAVSFAFLLLFVTLRVSFESWFWRKLFLMEKPYYCLLAIRDFANCCLIILNIRGLIAIIYKVLGDNRKLRVQNLGAGTSYVFLSRLASVYGFPIEKELIESSMPTYPRNEEISYPHDRTTAIDSAEFLIALVLLTSSIAKMLYLNSLYSYMAAVNLLSELDPFLQIQLRFDDRNGLSSEGDTTSTTTTRSNAEFNTNQRENPTRFSNNNGAPHTSAMPSAHPNTRAPTWGWPLSHFREDIAGSFSG